MKCTKLGREDVVPVEGWEGEYSLSSTGRVYTHKKDLWLQLISNGGGYWRVSLLNPCGSEEKYTPCYIHRLVAQHFLPNPKGLDYVGHKDHAKDNNDVSNLYWTDASTNTRDGVRAGRINYKGRCGKDGMKTHSNETVRLSYMDVKSGGGLMAVARAYGINRTTLASWVNKQSRTEVTDLLD